MTPQPIATPTAADFGRARVRLAMQRAVQETRRALVWERGEDGRAGDAGYYEACEDELLRTEHMLDLFASVDAWRRDRCFPG